MDQKDNWRSSGKRRRVTVKLTKILWYRCKLKQKTQAGRRKDQKECRYTVRSSISLASYFILKHQTLSSFLTKTYRGPALVNQHDKKKNWKKREKFGDLGSCKRYGSGSVGSESACQSIETRCPPLDRFIPKADMSATLWKFIKTRRHLGVGFIYPPSFSPRLSRFSSRWTGRERRSNMCSVHAKSSSISIS